MNITEFKTELKNRPVNFSYKKKDGTIREAYGTMSKSLLPVEIPSVKFKCTNINWDTDGRGQCGLPEKMTIEIDEAYLEELKTKYGEEDSNYTEFLEEAIADALSEASGYCVLDYEYECVEKRAPKKLSESTIFYYDLEKNGYRSFNESQLISWQPEFTANS